MGAFSPNPATTHLPQQPQPPHASAADPSLRHSSEPTSTIVIVSAGLVLAVFAVFGQTLTYDFVNFDDDRYVYDNPVVNRGLSQGSVAWAFTRTHSANWHPLTWLSHMLDCQIYGLAPWGHHLTNVLLHAANSVLLFLVFQRMTGSVGRSAIVAAVFAVHPLHVESVAWVAERKDVLSGLFFMLTLGAYANYANRPFALGRYLAVAALFACGLMSKPMLVTLPFVLLLLDYWPLRRLSRLPVATQPTAGGTSASSTRLTSASSVESSSPKSVEPNSPKALAGEAHEEAAAEDVGAPFTHASSPPKTGRDSLVGLLAEKLPLLAMAAASCVITLAAQAATSASASDLPFPTRVGSALISYCAYVVQMFFPDCLTVLYPYPHSISLWKAAAAGLVLAELSVLAWRARRNHPYLAVGWWWYVGMLVPVIGIVQVGTQAMADRYTYLPQIGLYVALVWGVAELTKSWPWGRWLRRALSVGALVVLGGLALRQTMYWRDSETLWNHALACGQESFAAHNNLATILETRGELSAAVEHLQRAMEIDPGRVGARVNFGLLLSRQGKLDEAVTQFRRALEIDSHFPMARYGLGMSLHDLGQTREAITHLREAIRLDPDHIAYSNSLVWILAACPDESIRNGPEAVELAERAVQLSAGQDVESLDALAAAYAETGRFAQAIEIAQRGAEVATRQGDTATASAIRKRIALYRAHRAFREER